MVTQLIRHERISTTVAKAKELRRMADKAITLGKKVTPYAWQCYLYRQGTEGARMKAAEIVRGEEEIFKLFTELAHRYKYRNGGYTRVVRAGRRLEDSADMAFIEFVDREGELRPARHPIPSLLPASARAMEEAMRSGNYAGLRDGSVEGEKPKEKKKSRFFGLF